jgi:hypothetical protein
MVVVATGLPWVVMCGSSDEKRRLPDAFDAGMAGAAQLAEGGAPAPREPSEQAGADAGGVGGMAVTTAGEGGGPASVLGGAGGQTAASGGEPAAGSAGDAAAGVAGESSGGAGGAPVLAADGFVEDFDDELPPAGEQYVASYIDFARWTVSTGSVDITLLPNAFIADPGGYGPSLAADGTVVDLNGSTSELGGIETTEPLLFAAGVTYTLSYALGNARPESNSVQVSIPGLLTQMRTQATITAFTDYQDTFTPAVDVIAKLSFVSQGSGDQDGLLVDSVSITAQ